MDFFLSLVKRASQFTGIIRTVIGYINYPPLIIKSQLKILLCDYNYDQCDYDQYTWIDAAPDKREAQEFSRHIDNSVIDNT